MEQLVLRKHYNYHQGEQEGPKYHQIEQFHCHSNQLSEPSTPTKHHDPHDSVRTRNHPDEPIRASSSWSSMPDDLMQRILNLLPLSRKILCRCVCKNWHSILSTDDLLSYTSNNPNIPSSKSFLLLTTKGSFAFAYNPSSCIWLKVPKPPSPANSILCASHHLACLGNQISECRSLDVLNLTSGTISPLPPMLQIGFIHKISMVVNPSISSFIILVTGEDSSTVCGGRHPRAYHLLTEVYDSISASWRMAMDVLPHANFGNDPGAWYHGMFYSVVEAPLSLIVFNVAKGSWMELPSAMPKGISTPSLVCCMGKLLMVGIQDYRVPYDDICHDTISDIYSYGDGSNTLSSTRTLTTHSLGTNVNETLSLTTLLTTTSKLSSMSSPSSPTFHQIKLPQTWSWPSSLQFLTSSTKTRPMSNLDALELESNESSLPIIEDHSSSSSSSSLPCKRINIWCLNHSCQWKLMEHMPQDLSDKFMFNLDLGSQLVCVGVGDEVCITSYKSPNMALFNIRNKHWRLVRSDPTFPKNRDAHMLGFTIQHLVT